MPYITLNWYKKNDINHRNNYWDNLSSTGLLWLSLIHFANGGLAMSFKICICKTWAKHFPSNFQSTSTLFQFITSNLNMMCSGLWLLGNKRWKGFVGYEVFFFLASFVLTLSFLSQRNLSLWALLCIKTPSRWPVSTERISMAFSPQPMIWLERM